MTRPVTPADHTPADRGFPTFYGVEVFDTEHDSIVAIGHPPLRRLLAAFNRFARVEWGLCNLADDPEASAADVASEVRYRWAALHPADPDADADEEWLWCPEGTPDARPFAEWSA